MATDGGMWADTDTLCCDIQDGTAWLIANQFCLLVRSHMYSGDDGHAMHSAPLRSEMWSVGNVWYVVTYSTADWYLGLIVSAMIAALVNFSS